MRLLWTEHALTCLAEIEAYVAEDDPVAAVELVDRLIARTDVLRDYPLAGRRVPELPKGSLRELVEGSYRIVYRVQSEAVEILSVFEGHRLLSLAVLGGTEKDLKRIPRRRGKDQ
jgi:plasmid stabilization system protein ParE